MPRLRLAAATAAAASTFLLLLLSLALAPVAGQMQIATFAGGVGDGSAATSVALVDPVAVATDGVGNVYIAAGCLIRLLPAGTGIITTLAGTGNCSYSGDGGPAISASFFFPQGLAVDGGGTVLISDASNNRIRRIAAGTGIISTLAGSGVRGFSGDGGLAANARLNTPRGLAFDNSGNVLIADTDNHRIRRVAEGTGVITTVAGTGVSGFSGDGGPGTSASLSWPWGVAVDGGGNVLIADRFNHRIRVLTTEIITTLAGSGSVVFNGDGKQAINTTVAEPIGVAVDRVGNVLILHGGYNMSVRFISAATGIVSTLAGDRMVRFRGDGGPAANASFNMPSGFTIDSGGNMLIADTRNRRVRKVTAATSLIETLAGNGAFLSSIGDGSAATSAILSSPNGLTVDRGGDVLIADTNNHRIRRVTASTGIITTLVGSGVAGFSGDGGPALSASVSSPYGLTVDSDGNVLIADTANHRIRRVTASTGIITTLAGNGVSGFSGDGGFATSAMLASPQGVAVDMGGNIFIAGNSRIRRVNAATGVITTLAGNGVYGFSGDGGPATSARLGWLYGMAVDPGGNIVFADHGFHRIRHVAVATGVITSLAGNGVYGFSGDGGLATSASLYYPRDVAVDIGGNVLIADTYNRRIRRVAVATGVITTLGGRDAYGGFDGDGGPAMNASFSSPSGIAVDSAGRIFVADDVDNRIRVLTPPSPSGTPSSSATASASRSASGTASLTASPSATASLTPSATPSRTGTPTPSPLPCPLRLFPRHDVVGDVLASSHEPSEAHCMRACCDAGARCVGYAFHAGGLGGWVELPADAVTTVSVAGAAAQPVTARGPAAALQLRAVAAQCTLLANVSQLVPSNGWAGGITLATLGTT